MISSANRDNFISSFPICFCFFLLKLFWLILPLLLNKNGGSGHPCFFPDLRGSFQPFSVECNVSCGFVIQAFIILTYDPSAAAAKSLQSFPTLCDLIEGSPPGSSVPEILQARILEWVAVSFSNACMHAKSLQLCLTLCEPVDSSPTGSSVCEILQARVLEYDPSIQFIENFYQKSI